MKLKKSLLIVPAMGTLLLAAAGSVGGTVAWFSANNTWNINAGNYTVREVDGSLDATLALIENGGVQAVAANGKSITIAAETRLADSSFNDHTVYTDTGNTDGTATGYEAKATIADNGTIALVEAKNPMIALSSYDGTADHDIYWALAWKVTLNYRKASTVNYNLYLDYTSTYASIASDPDTARGFRVAFVPITGAAADDSAKTVGATGVARTWAPYTNAAATGLYHVKAAGTGRTVGTTVEAYSETNLILPANTAYSGNATNVACYLGTFAGTSGYTVNMSFICVAWYEGEDPSIVSSNSVRTPVANLPMNFFVKAAS